jgi:hypothetical protein
VGADESILNPGDDQADFIHMGCDHQRVSGLRAAPSFEGDQIAHRVGAHFVGQRTPKRFDGLARRRLPTCRAGSFAQCLYEFPGVQGLISP